MAKMNWKSKEDIQKEEEKQKLERQFQEEKRKQTEALEKFMQFEMERLIEADELTEEQKLLFLDGFEPFHVGEAYEVGKKVRYEGKVYEVIQSHTSQADWLPPDVPALFKVYLQKETEEGDEVVHEWIQPTGAHDAYSIGDKVQFNGIIYISTVDGNVWSPEEFGWEEV